jgi:hypothetical protein
MTSTSDEDRDRTPGTDAEEMGGGVGITGGGESGGPGEGVQGGDHEGERAGETGEGQGAGAAELNSGQPSIGQDDQPDRQ